MSPRRLHRRYWDANAFLGILNGEPDKVPSCKSVLQEASRGKLIIVTSALTLTEVVRVKGKPRLAPDKEQDIVAMFKHEYYVVWDCTRTVAEKARELIWQHDFLQYKDAIHVATAILAEVDYLDTFDTDLIKLSERIGDPALKIGKPNVPSQGELELTHPEDEDDLEDEDADGEEG